jgi:hypothetical protein
MRRAEQLSEVADPFANPHRGGVWRWMMTWVIVFFVFVCLVVLVFS